MTLISLISCLAKTRQLLALIVTTECAYANIVMLIYTCIVHLMAHSANWQFDDA